MAMIRVRDGMDLKHKKTLRLGLLLLSTLIIIGASALVYDRVIYENALNVGNTGGVSTGSTPTAPSGLNLILGTIIILGGVAAVIGLSIFGLLREAVKHVKNSPDEQESSSTHPGVASQGDDEWEESLNKEESEK